MSGIVCDRICKSFGETQVLGDVSLEIADGEFLTLLGPSGCGKSTLLRIIAGLEPQTSGSVSIDGVAMDHLRPKQRDVAMVFQSYALYPHMSVAENMATPLRMRQMSQAQRFPLIGRFWPGSRAARADIDKTVREVAEALEIGHLLGRKPGQLSGGQRQRVAVGRAMVRRPKVFLMDEPLSNLDAKLRVAMRAEIKALHRKLGITFIYVTHDQSEAMTLSDRVAVMMEGKLLQLAPPQALYAAPADVRVAAFIGSPKINLLDGTVRGDGAVELAGTVLPIQTDQPAGTKVTAGIRPENLTLADDAENSGVTADVPTGQIAGTIRELEHLGSDLYVHLGVDGAADPVIARIDPGAGHRLAHGDGIALTAKPGATILFDAEGKRLAPPHANGHDREAKSVDAGPNEVGATAVKPTNGHDAPVQSPVPEGWPS